MLVTIYLCLYAYVHCCGPPSKMTALFRRRNSELSKLYLHRESGQHIPPVYN